MPRKTPIPATLQGADSIDGAESSKKRILDRVSYNRRPDGSIAVDRMHPTKRDELKRAAPRLLRDLGILDPPQPAAAPASPVFPPELIGGAVCQLLTTIDVLVLSRVPGATRAIVEPIAQLGPNERQAIEPLAVAILNKYSGAWMAKYGEEVALLVLYSSIITQKLAAVRAAIAESARRPAAPPAPAVPESARAAA